MAITWQEYNAIPLNTRIFNHYADECAALVNYYTTDCLGLPLPPGFSTAVEWWTRRSEKPEIYQNFVFSSTPVAGAIFIGQGGIYNAGAGHIGTVTAVHPDGSFDTMEQNAGTWRYVGRYRRDLRNILGFLVPKNNPAPQPAQDLDAVANAVIRGEYGNGDQRRAALAAAGYDYDAVQARVNERLGAVGSASVGLRVIVDPGDSLSSIAAQFGSTWQAIYAANRAVIGDNPNLIYAGQELIIP